MLGITLRLRGPAKHKFRRLTGTCTSIATSPHICDNLTQRSSMPPPGVDGCEKVPFLCGRDSRRGPCLQALWTRSGARRFAVCAVRDSHAVGNGSRHRPTRSPQEANQRRRVACDDRLRARVSGLVLLVARPSTIWACDAARGGRCSFLSDGTNANATPATEVTARSAQTCVYDAGEAVAYLRLYPVRPQARRR